MWAKRLHCTLKYFFIANLELAKGLEGTVFDVEHDCFIDLVVLEPFHDHSETTSSRINFLKSGTREIHDSKHESLSILPQIEPFNCLMPLLVPGDNGVLLEVESLEELQPEQEHAEVTDHCQEATSCRPVAVLTSEV